jgi:MFS family permease
MIKRTLEASFSPLRFPHFRVLWLTFVLSNTAMWMFDTTATLYLVESGASPLEIALVQTASALPVFMLGLPSGALADLVCRRRLYLIAQVALFVGAAFAFVLMQNSIVSTTLILFCVFFYGLGFALRWPAYASLVPSVLPLSQLQQAFALNSLAMNFARILGPVIAGWTFVRFSPDIAFLVVALISLLSFWLVRKSDIPSNTPKFLFGRVIPAIKEGIGICFMNEVVRKILVLIFVFFFSGISTIALAALIGAYWLPSIPLSYSFLLSSMGLGAIVSVLALPKLRESFSSTSLIRYSLTIQGLLIGSLYFVRQDALLFLIFFLSGLFWVCVVSILTVSIQTALQNEYRARGMSIYQICIMGGSAIGAGVWGSITTTFGLDIAFLISGISVLTCLFLKYPEVK